MKPTGTVGYAAIFEQFHPTDLLNWSKTAEKSGFGSVMASDHFHPWTPDQGQSAFVWSWMGALGATTNLRFGTGVTPPGFRYHPAIIAQGAATLEAMYPGRFWLGLGAGEALNEHVVGEYWPEAPTRLRILMEAIEVIRRLFTGKVVKYSGEHIKLESARLYTNPEDFAAMAKLVHIDNFKNRVLVSADLDEHLEHVQHYVDLGFDEVYIHNVGRNQEEFIRAYGERVIPKLRWPDQ